MDLSHFFCFERNDLKIISPTFFLDQSKIPLVEQCTYLGTAISINNTDLDLKRRMRQMYANDNLLLREFSKCSVNVKCYLFKTYCSNLYFAPMWFDCTNIALINKIERRLQQQFETNYGLAMAQQCQ